MFGLDWPCLHLYLNHSHCIPALYVFYKVLSLQDVASNALATTRGNAQPPRMHLQQLQPLTTSHRHTLHTTTHHLSFKRSALAALDMVKFKKSLKGKKGAPRAAAPAKPDSQTDTAGAVGTSAREGGDISDDSHEPPQKRTRTADRLSEGDDGLFVGDSPNDNDTDNAAPYVSRFHLDRVESAQQPRIHVLT